MGIVFVHGVTVRKGRAYDSEVKNRNALLRRYLHGQPEFPASGEVEEAYWGDHAAKFRFNHACLPKENTEDFGLSEELENELLAEFMTGDELSNSAVLPAIAAKSPAAAMDLLIAFAALGSPNGMSDDLAAFSVAVGGRVDAMDKYPATMADLPSDKAVLDTFHDHLGSVVQPGAENEAFGPNEIWVRLGEGLRRLRSVADRQLGAAAVAVLRNAAHRNVALFMGDVLTYLDQRGARDNLGKIPSIVAQHIIAAQSAAPGEPTLVIAHSMGGNIVYDLLTHLDPKIQVDTLVTVGSQVGLFEELSLFGPDGRLAASRPARKPPGVTRWLNVFDTNDPLGYAAEGIFDDVKDLAYSTGRGVIKAHTSYFLLPSFYRRLAVRLAEDP
jgi:hypothetical protein